MWSCTDIDLSLSYGHVFTLFADELQARKEVPWRGADPDMRARLHGIGQPRIQDRPAGLAEFAAPQPLSPISYSCDLR
jgi:hypothetical protein